MLFLKYLKYCVFKLPLYGYSSSYSIMDDKLMDDLLFYPIYPRKLFIANGQEVVCLFKNFKRKSKQKEYKNRNIHFSYKWIILGYRSEEVPQLKDCKYKEFVKHYGTLFKPQLTDKSVMDQIEAAQVMDKLAETKPLTVKNYEIITKLEGTHLL